MESELKAVAREIRTLERLARRERRLAGYRPAGEEKSAEREEATRRRLASYLSTGSFPTIAHPKFRSDLVRRRRLLIGGTVIGLLAAAWIIWKMVL